MTEERSVTGLFTDLYELTMAQAYLSQGLTERACFSLFVRDLPAARNFLLAAGIDEALAAVERVRFDADAIAHLRSLDRFSEPFLDWLRDFRFAGDIHAVPDGTVLFANEPLLEVEGPIAEAQLLETLLLNQVTFATAIASKGARSVLAAEGRPVIDFGTRRSHGFDAALQAARALYVAGFAATSNVEAGRRYDIPVSGTMAHSFVQAHESELEAFRAFTAEFPDTTLLIDTYGVDAGLASTLALAKELGERFRVTSVRIDSGDLGAHARRVRAALDEAGLADVRIVASGGLEEHAVDALVRSGAPIDVYAVGTRVNVPADAPILESAYKLVAYAGVGRRKRSEGKVTLPGAKQVYRSVDGAGRLAGDVLALRDEELAGEPLLRPAMRAGRRQGAEPLSAARERAAEGLAMLPPALRSLDAASPRYAVRLSPGLERAAAQ